MTERDSELGSKTRKAYVAWDQKRIEGHWVEEEQQRKVLVLFQMMKGCDLEDYRNAFQSNQ